jgi:hypothetical protein
MKSPGANGECLASDIEQTSPGYAKQQVPRESDRYPSLVNTLAGPKVLY